MKVLGIYFSGTGNTKYVLEKMKECLITDSFEILCIEDDCDFKTKLMMSQVVVLAYPIYGSVMPKIFRTFLQKFKSNFNNKSVITVATQLAFSGDGAALAFYELKDIKIKKLASIHINMPTNLQVRPFFKIKNGNENNKKLIKANRKIQEVCKRINQGKSVKNGQGFFAWFLGFFGQRLWFKHSEKSLSKKIRIASNCTLCGLCEKICPCNNLLLQENKIVPQGNCTLCYRCVNACPHKAIHILTKTTKQYKGVLITPN